MWKYHRKPVQQRWRVRLRRRHCERFQHRQPLHGSRESPFLAPRRNCLRRPGSSNNCWKLARTENQGAGSHSSRRLTGSDSQSNLASPKTSWRTHWRSPASQEMDRFFVRWSLLAHLGKHSACALDTRTGPSKSIASRASLIACRSIQSSGYKKTLAPATIQERGSGWETLERGLCEPVGSNGDLVLHPGRGFAELG